MNTAFTPLPITATAAAGVGLGFSFRRVGLAIWRALQAAGRARAHVQLLELADRCQALQPALAGELRAASRQGPLA